MAPKLRLKGKGHEVCVSQLRATPGIGLISPQFSDAARLLSFYQEWLDDLFPKATFLDALAMAEKAGHKTTMRSARQQWIEEGKPRSAAADEDEEHLVYQAHAAPQANRVAPIFDKAATQGRAKTPTGDDLFGDDDIYNATPRRNTATATAPARQVVDDGIPDDDDLDALMAEVESGPSAQPKASGPASAPFGSIFGNGSRSSKVLPPAGEPDEDDLDALMAEAEAQAGPSKPSPLAVSGSIFGDGKSKQQATLENYDDEDDLDALMAEAEAEAAAAPPARGEKVPATNHAQSVGKGDEDDLDALMAEAEAEASASTLPPTGAKDAPAQKPPSFEEDEEAMAEMDGLW